MQRPFQGYEELLPLRSMTLTNCSSISFISDLGCCEAGTAAGLDTTPLATASAGDTRSESFSVAEGVAGSVGVDGVAGVLASGGFGNVVVISGAFVHL